MAKGGGRGSKGKRFSSEYQPVRKPMDKDVKSIRMQCRDHAHLIAQTLCVPRSEAKERLLDPERSLMFDYFQKSLDSGDMRFVNSILDRVLGKPKQEVEMKTKQTIKSTVNLKELSTEQLEKIKAVMDGND